MRRLRVLIATDEAEPLEPLVALVIGLGHEVAARATGVSAAGAAALRERPDVAVVWRGSSAQHALDAIEQIVRQTICPVITIMPAMDLDYVREAAGRGVFAYTANRSPEDLQGAIEVTVHRFAEYQNLQGAFGRRAVIEQGKGILMGRHAIDADQAYTLLRDHSQRTGAKVSDVAAALVGSHLLLVPAPPPAPNT